MTPARSSFGTLNAARSIARDWGRWKKSSSLLAGSPKVMWQCASIRPGITVAPRTSIVVRAGVGERRGVGPDGDDAVGFEQDVDIRGRQPRRCRRRRCRR